jgi:chemotaxis protein MotB
VRRPLRAALAALGLGLCLGCVGLGTHREVVEERDRLADEKAQLAERVRLLEASNASLSAERVRLLEETEDLREKHASLEEGVADLQRRHDALSESLTAREAELASRSEEVARLRGTYEGLVSDLEAEVQAGQIQIQQLREGLMLNVSDAILFPSGSAQLSVQGKDVLARVAGHLKQLPDRVEVQGHTDDVPIATAIYPSNWELAAARATGVVRWLEGQGLEARRLSGVSFGEQRPVAPNDTPEGRARNRRIEIRLLPERGAGAAAPEAAPPAPPSEPPGGAAPAASDPAAAE